MVLVLAITTILLVVIEVAAAAMHFYWGINKQGRIAVLSAFRHSYGPKIQSMEMELAAHLKNHTFPNYGWNPQLHHPDSGYLLANPRNSTILYCEENELPVNPKILFATDNYGFRNQGGANAPYDVLMIGDSYVEGACVSDKKTLPSILHRNGIKTYNLGRGGAGPLFELALLREYGSYVRSREVVWVIFAGNDLQNLREEKTTQLYRYLDPRFSQHLFENREKVDAELKTFLLQRLTDHGERFQIGARIPEAGPYGETLDALDARKYESKLLREVAELFRKESEIQRKSLSIVVLYRHPSYDANIQDIVAETMRAFGKDHGLPLAFVEMDTARETNHLPGHFDSHYYEVIGLQLAKWLTDNTVVRNKTNVVIR